MPDTITIPRPDDCHLHLRDGAAMADVLAHTARVFGRAVVMPNLRPAVTTVAGAEAYRARILAARPASSRFEPLMTLYLTDRTTRSEIAAAAATAWLVGAKLYPAGATTNADEGVTDIDRIAGCLDEMERRGLPLLVHGEVVDPEVDVFDREAVFIDRVLAPLVGRHPALRVVFEHITTRQGVDFVRAAPAPVAATITPHHLLLDRNAIFDGGLDPHHYCLPVLKTDADRRALVAAATGDDGRFFLGTDSAPHPQGAKERRGGAAGIFSAHAALELCAEVFDGAGALGRLAAFAAERGADFYRLERPTGAVTLVRDGWRVADSYPFGGQRLIPLRAGRTIGWRVADG